MPARNFSSCIPEARDIRPARMGSGDTEIFPDRQQRRKFLLRPERLPSLISVLDPVSRGRKFPGLKQYALKRAARIMPGYYLAMIISTIMGVIYLPNLQYIFLKFFTGMTFTSCFHYLTLFPSQLDSPLWSISFEVFCYVLLPVFMAVLFFFTGKKRSFAKAVLFWAGAQILPYFAQTGLSMPFLLPTAYTGAGITGLPGDRSGGCPTTIRSVFSPIL